MSSLLDELEAGELSIEFEGEEPQTVLEWAIERVLPNLAISTSFQIDSVALIDMAYEIDPDVPVFSVDTGPASRRDLRARRRACAPAIRASSSSSSSPNPSEIDAMVGKHGVDLFKTPVDLRLALLQPPQGSAAHQAPARARRLGHRPPPRPVGEPHEHPQDRDRPRPRRDRQAQPARRVDRGRGLGLRPRARRAVPLALRPRLHLDRLRARAPARSSRASASRPGRWWWETNAPKECGIHCSIESGGLEHELHALLGEHAHA